MSLCDFQAGQMAERHEEHVRAEKAILRDELDNYKIQCEDIAHNLQKSQDEVFRLDIQIKQVILLFICIDGLSKMIQNFFSERSSLYHRISNKSNIITSG